ncbi:hypothetical protein HDU76_010840, partial [Blyttiomyces sp. JEL0837]
RPRDRPDRDPRDRDGRPDHRDAALESYVSNESLLQHGNREYILIQYCFNSAQEQTGIGRQGTLQDDQIEILEIAQGPHRKECELGKEDPPPSEGGFSSRGDHHLNHQAKEGNHWKDDRHRMMEGRRPPPPPPKSGRDGQKGLGGGTARTPAAEATSTDRDDRFGGRYDTWSERGGDDRDRMPNGYKNSPVEKAKEETAAASPNADTISESGTLKLADDRSWFGGGGGSERGGAIAIPVRSRSRNPNGRPPVERLPSRGPTTTTSATAFDEDQGNGSQTNVASGVNPAMRIVP